MSDLISRQAANTKMKKYRKKPIVIDAYQTDRELDIETLEGIMHASVGDYIIIGVNGERYPCKPDIFEKTYEGVFGAEKRIEKLPSAQPERKKGKWIPETEDWRNQIVWVKCSECGFNASTSYNYCPNCGAKMEEGDQE